MLLVNEKLHQTIDLLSKWGCSEQQTKRLLGIRYPKTIEMYTTGGVPIPATMISRLNFLETIDRVLSNTFQNNLQFLRYDFMNRRNDDPLFLSDTPLQFILRGIKNLEKAANRLSELHDARSS